MEDSIRTQCEQSFYEELYHYGSGKRSIVMDRVSERVYFRKILSVYNIDVFRYLKSHSNIHIPKVHSFWEEDGKLIVIEELISGYTLDYLLENEKLDDKWKREILIQVCDGLIFLHSAEPQIIHRDLKPSNIMVTDEGIVKIIDYDAAKVFNENEKKDTVLIGTRGSAAPEQYGFGKCDERTDIYALGILIREMFPDDPAMQRIADKATRLEPENRYQHVSEIRSFLAGDRYAGRTMEKKSMGWRRILQIPGFRSRTPWKMILASACYLLMIYFFFTFEVTSEGRPVTGAALWINRIAIIAICLGLVDLFTDWTGLFSRIPALHSRNLAIKILSYAGLAAAIFFFWAFLCVIGVEVVS